MKCSSMWTMLMVAGALVLGGCGPQGLLTETDPDMATPGAEAEDDSCEMIDGELVCEGDAKPAAGDPDTTLVGGGGDEGIIVGCKAHPVSCNETTQ